APDPVAIDDAAAAGIEGDPVIPAAHFGIHMHDAAAPVEEADVAVAVTAQVATHFAVAHAVPAPVAAAAAVGAEFDAEAGAAEAEFDARLRLCRQGGEGGA